MLAGSLTFVEQGSTDGKEEGQGKRTDNGLRVRADCSSQALAGGAKFHQQVPGLSQPGEPPGR